MEPLIPLINRLQDVFTAVGSSPIHLPQLVVVGSQSSGKSSVLEHIVGRDFLPRGQGIVTRRPLILQLVNSRDEDDDDEDDDDDGSDDEDDNDSDDVLDKRRPYHNRPAPLTPPTKSSGPILLLTIRLLVRSRVRRVPSQAFPSLPLVRRHPQRDRGRDRSTDGAPTKRSALIPSLSPFTLLTCSISPSSICRASPKVAVGDQPTDIERVIEDMVLSYITQPHSLIIAVTPANTDLANSDALKLARQVDPDGRRTLGVLTKVDLMDKGDGRDGSADRSGVPAGARLRGGGVSQPARHQHEQVDCGGGEERETVLWLASSVPAHRSNGWARLTWPLVCRRCSCPT